LSSNKIVAIIDNDSRYQNTFFDGIEIFHPSKIRKLEYDIIVVCPIFFEDIIDELLSYGVSRKKIEIYKNILYFSKLERIIGNSQIGRYSYFKSNTLIIKCEIGNFTHIGENCIIGQGSHGIENVTTYPLSYHFSKEINDVSKEDSSDVRKNTNKTIIKNDVYIGESVVVQGGLEIGNGAVIASRAVVTKNVPDYAVVAGVPAKIIKFRFPENEIKNLLKIEWWSWDDKKIKKEIESFKLPIENFIKIHSK
jgi:acetyltransferase-like isoleucine patch superfamily enzyme